MRDLANRAIRGSIWIASASYSGFVLTFVSTAVLARLLPPKAFGVYALAQSYSIILLAVGAFGFTQAIVQSSSRDARLADTALIMTVVVRVILGVISVPIALIIAQYHGADVALAFFQLSLVQIADAIRIGLTITLERDLEYGRVARMSLLSNVVSAVASISAGYAGLGASALVIRDAALSISLLFIAWLTARRWKLPLGHAFDRHAAKEIWKFGRSIYFVRALDQIASRIDRILLGSILSLDVLGIYHQAKYLASLPANALAPGNFQVAITTYSKIKTNVERLSRAFYTVQYFVTRLVPPFVIICAIWPAELLGAVCGPRWMAAEMPLRILALFVLSFAATEGYRSLFTALEAWVVLRRSAIIQAVTLIVVLPLLASFYGAVGASAATLLASVAAVTYLRLESRRHLIVVPPSIRGIAALLCAFGGALACRWGVAVAMPRQSLALGVTVSVLLYGAMVILWERGEVWTRCRAVLNSALSRA